MSVDCVCLMTG